MGTSGNFPARLGQGLYIVSSVLIQLVIIRRYAFDGLALTYLTLQFGVEAHLSQFTLTKIVNVSPYYMLVNETEVDTHYIYLRTYMCLMYVQVVLNVAETATPHNKIVLSPGEVTS